MRRPTGVKPALSLSLVLVALMLGGTSCSESGGRDDGSTEIVDAESSATSEPSTIEPGGLRGALVEVGVDVRSAPPRAVNGPRDRFCGVEEGSRPPVVDEAARRCFLDAHLARLAASFVSTLTTVEGDPIVTLWRTRDDGTVERFTDATRDSFGSGAWSTQVCSSLVAGSAEEPVAFSCERGRAYESLEVDRVAPDWFSDRAVLPLCGYASLSADPSIRACLADALATGDPAELVYVSVGDEGESSARWFRVVGPGDYEVLERQLPSDAWPGSGQWLRHECSTFVFLDEPGYEVDQLPQLNAEGECAVVETG